jgi:hypothetical protein
MLVIQLIAVPGMFLVLLIFGARREWVRKVNHQSSGKKEERRENKTYT